MADAPTVDFGLWYDFSNPDPSHCFERFYEETLEQIVWAEPLGFDPVWISEHHFCDDGYTPSPPVLAGGARRRQSTPASGWSSTRTPSAPGSASATTPSTSSTATSSGVPSDRGTRFRASPTGTRRSWTAATRSGTPHRRGGARLEAAGAPADPRRPLLGPAPRGVGRERIPTRPLPGRAGPPGGGEAPRGGAGSRAVGRGCPARVWRHRR